MRPIISTDCSFCEERSETEEVTEELLVLIWWNLLYVIVIRIAVFLLNQFQVLLLLICS